MERNQFNKHIRNYEKNMAAAKLKWESISKEKQTLRELLFEERILNEEAGLKCDEYSKKLLKNKLRKHVQICRHL